ncbi:head GIN domain-containing protein [uncultured Chitinophaga sp.]|jgi:Protein of unknown function (DUF2807).|uniref:head GIN domain-containing protein n=1 Tax=uncultured Chitinophaga sp. TaxID=339340 RepID=UPI002629D850|nr:head GIN domain-containing protein [uncultured Chitinophaga sp.]
MKKKYCCPLFFLFAFNMTAYCQGINGSGHVVSQSRKVKDFSVIRVDIAATIYLDSLTNDPDVRIEAEDNFMGYILCQNDGDALVIKNKSDVWFNTDKGIKVYVPYSQLSKLISISSGNIISHKGSVRAAVLEVETNGSGLIDLRVSCNKLKVKKDGSSIVKLNGNCNELEGRLKGSGNMDARTLTAGNVKLDVRGSVGAQVKCTSTLDVVLGGSANVVYLGDPVVTKRLEGSGNVAKVN